MSKEKSFLDLKANKTKLILLFFKNSKLMLLPPEIWNEIIRHVTKKDVLKFKTCKQSLHETISTCSFKIIINKCKLRVDYWPIDPWDSTRYVGHITPKTAISNRNNINNVLTFIENGFSVYRDVDIGGRDYHFVYLEVNIIMDEFTVGLCADSSTVEQSIKFKENKEIIIKFLADFRDAL